MSHKLLSNLNESQQKVVTTFDGAILVNAAPGSGKSRSIVNRTAYMIESGIDPSTIMLTTFTKKAAEEMKSRLRQLITYQQLNKLTIGTTHSICWSILKEEYTNINHNYSYTFYNHKTHMLDGSKLKMLLETIHKDMTKQMNKHSDDDTAVDLLSDMKLSDFISAISHAKNNSLNHEQFKKKVTPLHDDRLNLISEFYAQYENRKWIEKKLDFDDLLLLTVELFEQYPKILQKYQKKWKYIMVDEAMDNSTIQNKLMYMLAEPDNNICIIGDSDQSIYKFRSAEVKDFINFKYKYKHVTEIPLLINYRSKSKIVHMSNQLVKYNQIRIDKDVIPFNKDQSDCIEYNQFFNEKEEAEFVIAKIKELNAEGKKYDQMAVLYRTNAQSKSLEDMLITEGIPYTIKNGFSFYNRKEILDILSYIRLALDTDDNESFLRVINTPSRYLGKVFLQKVYNVNMTHYKALDYIQMKNYERNGVREFTNLIHEIQKKMKDGVNCAAIIQYILNQGRYMEVIKKDIDGGDERLENIHTLCETAKRFDDADKFINYIDLMIEQRKDSSEGVQLMSCHSSKGLEFDTVFLIGMNEGLLPHKYACDEEDIEEERRLAFVAITRAENWLYMSSLSMYNGQSVDVSRFISECGL